ncbi:hypothetical protein V1519DRAFT_476623, partial [Lipomyces tetrasporus]
MYIFIRFSGPWGCFGRSLFRWFVGFQGWCIFMYISNRRALSKKKRSMESRSLLPFSRLNSS